MKYTEFLKTQNKCPFCYGVKNRVLIENEKAFLTYAQAPYHKYHLLVVPKRHVENIVALTWDENVCITALITKAIKALDSIGHRDCTILARDNQALAKSVMHLHYHIIPGGDIEYVSINLEMRKLLTDAEENSLRKELKRITL